MFVSPPKILLTMSRFSSVIIPLLINKSCIEIVFLKVVWFYLKELADLIHGRVLFDTSKIIKFYLFLT